MPTARRAPGGASLAAHADLSAGASGERARAHRAPDPRERRHLQRLRGRRRAEPPVGARRPAVSRAGGRVGGARARPAPARAPAERDGRGSLRPAAAAARRADAAGARVQPLRISAPVLRRSAAGRRVPAPGRVRSGARLPTAAGASSTRARRRRRARATRSRIARRSPACFPGRSAICTSSRWRRSSRRSRTRSSAPRRATSRCRTWCCSRLVRTTRRTSSTRISRGTSGFRSSKAPISPCATIACS